MDLVKDYWTKQDYKQYLKYLESLQNNKSKEFNERIIKTKYIILGIKFPILRSIAKEISKGNYLSFLNNCKDIYFEEVFIYGIVSLNNSKYFNKYLDKIDNWALCDSYVISQKFILKDKDKYFSKYLKLLENNKTYYIRVGLVTLLNFYNDDKYLQDIFNNLSKIKNNDYYVLMGIAWLLQTISINNFLLVIDYLKKNPNRKIIIMTMQKVRDSYKILPDKKKEIILLLKSMV